MTVMALPLLCFRHSVERFRVQLLRPCFLNVPYNSFLPNTPQCNLLRPQQQHLLFPLCLHLSTRGFSNAESPHRHSSSLADKEKRTQSPADEALTDILEEETSSADADDQHRAERRTDTESKEEKQEGEDADFDYISAGDLSDCPPALQEFVFTNPHPFPFTVDPEDLTPGQIKAVVNTLLNRKNGNPAAAAGATAKAAAESGTGATGAAGNGNGVYTEASRWCSESGLELHAGEEEKWLQYPEPNVLWPNPLLHNHRLQPFTCSASSASDSEEKAEQATSATAPAAAAEKEEEEEVLSCASRVNKLQLRLNRLRLEELWKYAGVYGASWDELEEVYIHFLQQQQQRQQQWDSRKQQILEYAGVVCTRRLRAKRKEYLKEVGVDIKDLDPDIVEDILRPRSLFRRMTRKSATACCSTCLYTPRKRSYKP